MRPFDLRKHNFLSCNISNHKSTMHRVRPKTVYLFISIFMFVSTSLLRPQGAQAQGFYDYIRVIPEKNTNGVAMPGANTTFADGTSFTPDIDTTRSHRWAWRAQGDVAILSSLGPTSTLPNNTKELVTTVNNLVPGAQYAVKVLFWSNDPWGIRAGLTYANGTRSNTWFDSQSTNVVLAEFLPWKNVPGTFSDGGRDLYAASVGVGTANASGELKVFIHDLPTANSSLRTWYNGVAVSRVTASAQETIDANSAGTPFSRGVRGQALISITMDRGEYLVATPKALEVARGGAIRGVFTGLAAEIYDWRTRNNDPAPPTLEFLRYSRDSETELFLGANMRGLIEPNPEGGQRYYDTNISTVAAMAGDWVRYVNHIVPAYRQGDSITNGQDAAVLNSITWNSGFDSWEKLLAPGEAAVPKVKYWEIGNEPTYGVKAYSVSNSFTLNPTDYGQRYQAIATAIKAEDPTVKVGPTLAHIDREMGQLLAVVTNLALPLDFITWHPYERMGQLDDPAQITRHLGSVHTRQMFEFNKVIGVVAESGRNTNSVEYAATEVNVSSWETDDSDKEARMAHALGTVETVFSHARLGLTASLYWVWPSHRWDGTEYPSYKAYEALRDHMGDTLLSVYAFQNIRVYTTRDSETGELAVWLLNFSNTDTTTVRLDLNNLPNIDRAKLMRLEAIGQATTLFSANLSSEMTGTVPVINVDWTTTNVTSQDLSQYQLSLPAATLSVLVLEPGLPRVTPVIVEQEGEKRFSVNFRRLPHASKIRYELMGSNDLVQWDALTEEESGITESISLTAPQPMSDASHRFYRIRAVRE